MNRRASAGDWWVLGALWIIFGALGNWLVSVVIRNYPVVATREGEVADEAIFFLLRFTVLGVILIGVTIVYSVIRFRAIPGEVGDSPVQNRSNPLFVWVWVGLSVVLNVLFVLYPGVYGLRQIAASRAASNLLVVEASGLQWGWRFSYPQYGLLNRKELVLPQGRTVKFMVTSRDVIHSFWVPAFRLKIDAVPGMTNLVYLTPERLISTQTDPTARVQCAELCGIGHAQMRAPVRVVPTEGFDQWLQTQGASASNAKPQSLALTGGK